MSEITSPGDHWGESDSERFLDHSEIFVPGRAEQLATLLDLIPAHRDEAFTLVELGAGGGVLAQAILERFARCRYVALDGSAVMRERMGRRLAQFSDRLEIRPFELAEQQWRAALPSPLRCVVSSLCVHHLTGEGKRALFRDMAARLEPGGALLLADILQPPTPWIADLYARQYDAIVRAQSLEALGNLSGYEEFVRAKWNYFIYDYPDPNTIDHPSLLSEQLFWLRDAGFNMGECFWMRAGHAVYGGFK
ncbi:MAG TPA: class I SAM-dependent methyltransferase [Ktedonobacteraceae bacterium]|nr:class I SAM-dependent methyltransferase [Ktedonobacteraceae bacterium]